MSAAAHPGSGHPHYLSGLDLMGRKVVVVGGGSVAQRRLPNLVAAGAQVHVVALEPTPAVESFGGITLHHRAYADGDLDGAWYAMACTDDPDVNAAVVAEAERRHTFCVRADDARFGTAVTPASGRHRDIQFGVLAGGDHKLSAALRAAISTALADGDLRVEEPPHPPGVALVGGGPGDPDLITVRGLRLLMAADVVVADRLAPPELLAALGPQVEIIDAAKVPYGRAMKQEAINDVLIAKAKEGKFVVRFKGGDPYVYGRGFEELQACVAAGVPVTVVPGIASPISVPSAAGIPVTHRGVTHEVVIVSGHVAPDHPDSLTDWSALARLRGTLVLMMAVERVEKFAQALLSGGRPADTPVAMIENGSLPTQRVLRTDLAHAAQTAQSEGLRPPAIVVIGDVAGFTDADDVLGFA
ncbi:MAG TPA: uroporphyrinogen-III C-methyltransferase [Gordonia polyisoprenivorans]|uniref:uroporphyrinogen-III C-methyltransferase n=1 Tax=Gordonia polyisoprenivorans TaxID=84595 RepID=A0A846WN56_9ACTN|nr:uroporphyrinogen-III C-methyltransferase [Gordonia polyisoprenivorans]NKY02687.1 uroporphyrinogen-III C-methyltransferase [Gordonia polyisoprenivorans]OZC30212.1 uroporphyrinogen-III C-methyltransferase [Gordonia polyisoprenivorans]WCB39932.1 uroporphyrinogen-III C-methyltransferase [Gordonia polyisoprenivorans]GAB24668.1 siroheme synthase CysG [Gordonia polyisoprenivorans NBRC 16320 = JCM 10675]HCS57774.1 uroporphyrinogen-III C-methyltransferase [Gordonia polyisoprenivorans]